jgi:hypothetical protein
MVDCPDVPFTDNQLADTDLLYETDGCPNTYTVIDRNGKVLGWCYKSAARLNRPNQIR